MKLEPIDLSALCRRVERTVRGRLPASATLQVSLESDLPSITTDASLLQDALCGLVLSTLELGLDGSASRALSEAAGTSADGTPTRGARAVEIGACTIEGFSAEGLWADAPGTFVDESPRDDRFVVLSVHHRPNLPGADEPGGKPQLRGSTPSGSAGGGGTTDVERIRRLFDPMFAAPAARATTGVLSLAACRDTVRELGALLRVGQRDDGGVRFDIYLPLDEDEDSVAPHSFEGSGRVLVVDDEPSVARLTGLVLDQHGFEVEVAVSGEQALDKIARASEGYRLIIVDLSMPDLSGVEVLRKARAMGCPAPMVLTSGYSKAETDHIEQMDEFAGYLQKPYRLEALLEVIRDVLGSSGGSP